ncbi:MAG: heavy-metal-associated domain-containing protein, partial [Solirubrobacteraceae bacterium]
MSVIARSGHRAVGLPLRAIGMGIRATSGLIDATVHSAVAAAEGVGTVASASLEIATVSVRTSAKVLSGEYPGPELTRRHWRGDDRAWIEVRGLNCPDGAERGRVVLDALRGMPGVKSASLNRPLARAVIEFDNDQASLSGLCAVVSDAEKRWQRVDGSDTEDASSRAGSLPGDGLLLATRGAMVGVNAAGLAVAVAGRALRWPRAPIVVDAAAAVANYQPW